MSLAKITVFGSMAFGAGCAEKTSSTLGCDNTATKMYVCKNVCNMGKSLAQAERADKQQETQAMKHMFEECMGM